MICIIALIVFGIMGIFSAAYRKIAKEALDCVFKRITLRKCDTGLDQRLKSKIIGGMMKRNQKAAKFVFKNFEVLSWIFTILLIGSLAYTAYGLVNLAIYGNCNGNQGGFCIFAPSSNIDVHQDVSVCSAGQTSSIKLSVPLIGDDPSVGPVDAKVTVIEFACFTCQYSKKAEPIVKEMLNDYPNVRYVFKSFPIMTHAYAYEAALADQCAREQNKFWEFKDKLFENQEKINNQTILGIAKELGLNQEQFNSCFSGNKYQKDIEQSIQEAKDSGVYGTPTFFINNQVLVGPKSFDELKNAIEKEMKK